MEPGTELHPDPGPAQAGSCPHRFLELWGTEWHCGRCKAHITDRVQTDREQALAEQAEQQDAQAFGGLAAQAAESSYRRGVTVDWLVRFTTAHQCWDWPTWRLKEDLIKPATEETRGRYADLPSMADVVGPADVFASHCWGAPWGDLVAAVADGASPQRRVWIDVFAVRQWPGNGADLDFRGVVQRCPVMILCCTSSMDLQVYDSSDEDDEWAILPEDIADVSMDARKNIAFCRVWCLVEIGAAITHRVPVVMKGGGAVSIVGAKRTEGRAEIPGSNGRIFLPDGALLTVLEMLVDVQQADATNPADKAWILAEVEAMEGGSAAMNRLVQGAIHGAAQCMDLPAVQAAACGEMDALQLDKMDHDAKGQALIGAAAGGYLPVLIELIAAGAPLEAVTPTGAPLPGYTAISLAVYGQHLDVISALVAAGADVDSTGAKCGVVTMGTQGFIGSGFSALMTAVMLGHVDTVSCLLRLGASVHQGFPDWRVDDKHPQMSPLTLARKGQHSDIERVLVEAGAVLVLDGQ
jgi:hypothetical protein